MYEIINQFKKDFSEIEKERNILEEKELVLWKKYQKEFMDIISKLIDIIAKKTGTDDIIFYLETLNNYKKYGISEKDANENIKDIQNISVTYNKELVNINSIYTSSSQSEKDLYIRGYYLVDKEEINFEDLEETEDFYNILTALLNNKIVSYIVNQDTIKKLNESTIRDFKNFKNRL